MEISVKNMPDSIFFTREICVCAHLTQTRDAQRACAGMEISVGTVITPSEKLDGSRLRYRSMNQFKSVWRDGKADCVEWGGISMNQYCVYLSDKNDAVYSK